MARVVPEQSVVEVAYASCNQRRQNHTRVTVTPRWESGRNGRIGSCWKRSLENGAPMGGRADTWTATRPVSRDSAAGPGPERRTLHLIDVENLCSDPRPEESRVRAVLARYRTSMAVSEADHVVLAAAGRTALFAGLAWPGVRVRAGRGPDGADRALLAAVDVDHTVDSYNRVVVASGDHIFVPLVRALRGAGVAVEIVAPTCGIAQVLRLEGAPVRHFELTRDCRPLLRAS